MAAVRRFIATHPLVLLFLLTPGIPEYLSGSSPVEDIVLNPAWFLAGLALNAALYLPGALLVREATLRWGKGWATTLALAFAYAIVEEGIGDNTMFNPSPDAAAGALGSYGHFLGVNWIWVPLILLVHAIYSIGIPLLLLGYALPETRGRSLLSDRGSVLALVSVALDVTVLLLLVHAAYGFFMGVPLLIGCLLAIGGLILLARRLPADALRALPGPPRAGRWAFFLVGLAFYPSLLLWSGVAEFWHVPAAAVVLSIPVIASGYLYWVLARVGNRDTRLSVLALVAGLLVPIAVLGVVSQILLPLVLVVDVGLFLFLRELGRKASAPSATTPPPAGPVAYPAAG